MRLVAFVLHCSFALAALPREARAQAPIRCASIDGGSAELAARDARDRLAFVRDVMHEQAHRARVWSWAWGITGTALAAGNFGRAALAGAADDRVDPLVSGTTSLFIPLTLLVKPLRVMGDSDALDGVLDRVSREAFAPCVTLARAEALFASSADDEARGAGPLGHAVVLGGNLAVGLFLGLGYQHWTGGLVTALGGVAIGELQIATQPTGAVDARDAYRRGALGSPRRAGVEWHLAPIVTAQMRGVAIELTL